jgi:hypothetical protein
MTDKSNWWMIEPVVRKVVRDWDPTGLFDLGAPEDENDREILQIVGRVHRIRSAADATAILSEVFAPELQPPDLRREPVASVGAKLYAALREAGVTQITE